MARYSQAVSFFKLGAHDRCQRHTSYAGAWTILSTQTKLSPWCACYSMMLALDMHEIAVVSGLAAAYRLGAECVLWGICSILAATHASRLVIHSFKMKIANGYFDCISPSVTDPAWYVAFRRLPLSEIHGRLKTAPVRV